MSALCPRLDAVTTNDSEGSVSVALIFAPLAARATATKAKKKTTTKAKADATA